MPPLFRSLGIILLAVGLLVQPTSPAGAQAASPAQPQNNLIPAQGLLNLDGSLRLDAKSSGSLDLKGWDVHIDPRHGPVFAPASQQGLPPIVFQFFGWFGLSSNAAGNGSFASGSQILAIAVSGTTVYVGGNFTDLNDNGTVLGAADYIAKWDGSNWSALGYGANIHSGALNNYVTSITLSGANLYAGGGFTSVNNKGTVLGAAHYIAKWDALTGNWSALGYGANASSGALNDDVFTIAASGSNVYAGGKFTNVNNKGTVLGAADYIAKWDALTGNWSALGYGSAAGSGALNNWVNAIAISGTSIYAGGDFIHVNNKGAMLGAADYIARWDGTNWSAVGYGADTISGAINYYVTSLAVSGTDLYVGGDFTDVNNKGTVLGAADFIAKWNGTNWSALGYGPFVGASPFAPFSGVNSIAISGNNVYIGGSFINLINKGTLLPAADNIARWNGSDWSALGDNGAGDGSINAFVNAIGVSGNNLYVGGWFTDVVSGGFAHPEADYIARFVNNSFNFASAGADDGWVLESGENTSLGGISNSTAATFNLGDDATNRQYRSILHFSTSLLPDNAVLLSASLKIKKAALVGADPFSTFQGLLVDIANLPFSGNAALQSADFQATASKNNIATFGSTAVGGWYTAALPASAFPFINRTAPTELRLRFKLDDNNNAVADYMKFFSGNTATTTDRPRLIISYYVP